MKRQPPINVLEAGVLTLVLALIGGCTASHVGDDASVSDASTPDAHVPDARTPPMDSPSCPDRDGDGFADARCGGDDCDDADPTITPSYAECVTPTRSRRCAAGALAESECPAAAPFCDARIGACATNACGDGVLHEGEACDDGNASDEDVCSTSCEDLPCTRSSECPEARPSCSDHRDDGTIYCRTLDESGSELGMYCDADEECATGWCDLSQHKCTAACASRDDCPNDVMGWCAPAFSPGCVFGCLGGAGCAPDLSCFPLYDGHIDDLRLATMCWPPLGTGRGGDFCIGIDDCHGGVCDFPRNRCSSVCATDADCRTPDAAGTWCGPFPLSRDRAPATWPVERFGMCLPEELRP